MLEAHGYKTLVSCGLAGFGEKHKDMMVYPKQAEKK